MTESQKQFEEWAINTKDQFQLPFFIMKGERGEYVDHATEISWQAWQASRAAIVVKLPEYEFCNHHRNILIDEVKTALDAAGVSYE